MSKLSVIIPAAGSGIRMNSDIPKPFLHIGDKTILEHTISRFLMHDDIVQIIVASNSEYQKQINAIFDNLRYQNSDLHYTFVEGGNERQYSIQNALDSVLKECDLVAIHDAVRPFISTNLINAVCIAVQNYDGAIIAVPAKDTIKSVNSEGIINHTPDRSQLWQAQTPQVFKKEILMRAFANAKEKNIVGTDDASLVELIDGRIKVIEGERENLKITYPVDLEIAKLIYNR